jgi:DNA-binding GntR family transcriptional regulator
MRQRYPAPPWSASSEPASPAYSLSDDLAGEDPHERDTAPADQVLANRIAAALAHRKPGWTLPRPSVLARRYNVTTREVAAAIDELAARHLIRLLPDGKACRVSPAEYMFDLAGQHGLVARVEPLHGQLSCKSHSVAWHPVRADISAALGIATDELACILQMLWTVGGEPAAATTSYLAGPAADPFLTALNGADSDSLHAILPMPPTRAAAPDGTALAGTAPERVLVPHALRIEMQEPPPWAAKILRLSARDSAIGITVRYAEPADGHAAALTVAVLRPDHFRVIVDSVVTSLAGTSPGREDTGADPPAAPSAPRIAQSASTVG